MDNNRKFHLDKVNNNMTDNDRARIKKALQGTPRNYKGGIAPFVRRLGFTDKMANMSLKEFYEYIHEQERQEREGKGGAGNE